MPAPMLMMVETPVWITLVGTLAWIVLTGTLGLIALTGTLAQIATTLPGVLDQNIPPASFTVDICKDLEWETVTGTLGRISRVETLLDPIHVVLVAHTTLEGDHTQMLDGKWDLVDPDTLTFVTQRSGAQVGMSYLVKNTLITIPTTTGRTTQIPCTTTFQ